MSGPSRFKSLIKSITSNVDSLLRNLSFISVTILLVGYSRGWFMGGPSRFNRLIKSVASNVEILPV